MKFASLHPFLVSFCDCYAIFLYHFLWTIEQLTNSYLNETTG